MESENITPKKVRKFWLSDYIYQKMNSKGQKDHNPRLGISRRMPRINRSHEKQLEDTLKILAKSGEPQQILLSFKDKDAIRNKSTNSNYNTSRCTQYTSSPKNTYRLSTLSPVNKFKKLSIDLLDRIKTQSDPNNVNLTPRQTSPSNRMQQRVAFQIKASNEWMNVQKQILKINKNQQLLRLQKRRIKKIRMGIDNRTIDELIKELKN